MNPAANCIRPLIAEINVKKLSV